MKIKLIVLLMLVSLTSCSFLTSRGRQEYSYRKYIRKSSVVRARQQKKFHFRAPQMAIRENAPTMTTQPESPQSMTAAPSEQPAVAEQSAPAPAPPPN